MNIIRKISENKSSCWLVNTGWTGGGHGVGARMPIKVTRSLLTAAINGDLDQATFIKDANIGFEVPMFVPGVDPKYLNPRNTWQDKAAYDKAAAKLINLFMANFEQYLPNVDNDVKSALGL